MHMVFWRVVFGAVPGLFRQQGASFADRSLLPSAPAATRAITPHEPEPPAHEPPRHTPPPTHEPLGPEHPPHPEHPTAEPDPLGAAAGSLLRQMKVSAG
jgi:hypothetical protein